MKTDKNGKELELIDYEAKEGVGIQIGNTGHKLWICIDGIAVLRVKTPFINLDDMRTQNYERIKMFSVRQKQEISEKVQQILKETKHPELPEGEIRFILHVCGAEDWSYADIENNGDVPNTSVNPWNEQQDPESKNEK